MGRPVYDAYSYHVYSIYKYDVFTFYDRITLCEGMISAVVRVSNGNELDSHMKCARGNNHVEPR